MIEGDDQVVLSDAPVWIHPRLQLTSKGLKHQVIGLSGSAGIASAGTLQASGHTEPNSILPQANVERVEPFGLPRCGSGQPHERRG